MRRGKETYEGSDDQHIVISLSKTGGHACGRSNFKFPDVTPSMIYNIKQAKYSTFELFRISLIERNKNTSLGWRDAKGVFLVNSSHKRIPNEYESTLSLYAEPEMSSGAK
jgi:hypothetical protein